MKIVFLDIDGVLNSSFWNKNHQEEMREGILIDKEKIVILATLIRKTDAKIILHSGWRNWFDDKLNPIRIEAEYLVDFLKNEGLLIDDVTPDLTTEEIRISKKFSLVKADEILLGQHQIKTNSQIGLTYFDIEKAEEILLN